MQTPIVRFLRACNPNEVLAPDDPRHVDCDKARKGGVAPLLARDFQRADPDQPLHRMFTGHLGVGKSTELKQLVKLLGEGEIADVIYFDVADHLDDTQDIRLDDLNVLFAERVIAHFKDKEMAIANSILNHFWERFKQVLDTRFKATEATFAPAFKLGPDVEVGIGEVKLEIQKGSPSSRLLLRGAISETRATLRAGLNDLLAEARKKLGRNVVIIADGIEKVPPKRHEEIFIDGIHQLVDLDAHVLFSVPMALNYHPRFSELTQAFGQVPRAVPMIHPDTDIGMNCMKTLIEKRATFAGVTLAEAFESDEVWQKLCRQSGGHVRQILMFIQSACSYVADLPITMAALDCALADYRNGISRQISSELWPWLRSFRKGKLLGMPEGIPEEISRELVGGLLVFEYINGQPTYDVAPEIRNLAPFERDEPAAGA